MSEDINVGAVSETLNTKMDRDAGNATPPLTGIIEALKQAGCSFVIETWVNPEKPTDGYRLWNDGYCEQWGRDQAPASANGTVTLVKEFKDTNYVVTNSTENSSDGGRVSITTYNTHSFICVAHEYGSQSPSYFRWKASGYLAKEQQ